MYRWPKVGYLRRSLFKLGEGTTVRAYEKDKTLGNGHNTSNGRKPCYKYGYFRSVMIYF
jgi:hypothetical protein